MKILLNYANEKYRKTQKFNSFTGKLIGGFDKVIECNPERIDKDYYDEHRDILTESRGNGLWLWKPYFILKTLEMAEDGDYIFYSDSGAFFIRNINSLIDSMKGDIWVSDVPLLEESFTKEECFEKMDCKTDFYRKSNQIQGTFLLIRNSEYSRKFIKIWLSLCEDKELLCPIESNDNSVLFSHREDQSILSLLCKKEGIKAHRDPSQRGKYPEWYNNGKYPYLPCVHSDKYKTILFLHKTKNVSLRRCLIDYVKCVCAHKMGGVIDKAYWNLTLIFDNNWLRELVQYNWLFKKEGGMTV